MQIQFLGAARTVTGSKHLVTTSKGKKILLDCGFFQGRGKDNDTLNRNLKFNPVEVDVLILSHAHIDHSGNVPNLVKQGFKGKIYCTAATKELCQVMLLDSAHIQESDIKYLNKRRKKQELPMLSPIYSATDVDNAIDLMQTVAVGKEFVIDKDISFHFTDSGHILGSVSVHLTVKHSGTVTNISFSGDIGRYNDLILKSPQEFRQADYILCESTYGNRLHDDTGNARQRLLEVVNKTCVEKRGKLIIPAFSLGRTQEIVYTLDQFKTEGKLPPINVYVDSPLAVDATLIMRKHREFYNAEILEYMKTDPDPFGFSNLFYVRKAEDSKKLNDSKEPCIIISASGMIEAGRIKHHLKNNIGNSNNTILMVGYCSPNSIGGRLMNGDKTVKIFGNEYEVKAEVQTISSFSAHADYEEMIQYLKCQDAVKLKKLFLVHGEYEVQQEFKSKLEKVGFKNIEIPEENSVVVLT
jgi:metallo-beta-lactamase family protein